MLTNYFKLAWRNIARQKIFSAINIIGLAFGICACMVIFLITHYEFSFDRFHEDGDRIYRIVGEMERASGEKMFLNSTISEMAGVQHEIPGFEAKAGFYTSDRGSSILVPQPNAKPKKFENRIPDSWSSTAIITWPEYFSIFKYQWLAGNAQTLSEPFKVILTESRAKKYFGNIPASKMIGKTIIYADSLSVTVSGIVRDWTGKTDFAYTDFVSVATAAHSFLRQTIPTQDWSGLNPHRSMAFVKLDKGVSPAQINARLAEFVQRHSAFLRPGNKVSVFLQPLSDLHFANEFRRGDDGDDFRKAYKPTLYILMGVALFILVLAAVNFINLATAQSIRRTREIGVRKVMGGSRTAITIQLLIETSLLTIIAVVIATLLVNPALALFADYIPEGVVFHFTEPSTMIFLAIVTISTTLLAGFYPAHILASWLPVLSLKGETLRVGRSGINLRRALIIFQFTVSLLFIICTLVMQKQMKFMMDGNKGFNSDAIVTINKWNDPGGKLPVFAEKIRHIAGVDQVIVQADPPMGFAQMSNTFRYRGKEEVAFEPLLEIGDEHYIPFYQMKLVAGRNLMHSDSLREVVVNETLTKNLGFTQPGDMIGKTLYAAISAGSAPVTVVGVIADFHQGSFHDVIRPAVIANMNKFVHGVAIRLAHKEKNAAEVTAILDRIGKDWKAIYPEDEFSYNFLNESISWLYGQEEKTAWLLKAAMIITIFISCMGLFGLVLFTARRRTKEIGIRKVLGASVTSISTMLSREFIVLVALGFVIASPIAYYLSHRWLQDFAYRTSIGPWIFLIAGLSALVIALITVSFQAVKAAIANPVKALRTE